MATVILIDASISMARLVSSKHQQTRKELVQRALLHFLESMEANHPLEFVCLVTFSSTSQVIAPFTRDYTLLRSALYDIRLQDTTDLHAGLTTAVDAVKKKFGTSTACQFVVVTDGRPNGPDPSMVHFPFPVKLHVVAVGSRAELDLPTFEQLTRKRYGGLYFVELPQGARTLQQTFDKLAHTHYLVYKGTLFFGHLCSNITLYPNPNVTHSFSTQQDVTSSHFFPSALSIVGFISTKKFSSPPSLSQHAVIPSSAPPKTPSDSTNKTSKGGDFKPSSSIDSGSSSVDETSDKDKSNTESSKKEKPVMPFGPEIDDAPDPLLCVMLNNALDRENMFAIIQLSSNWFAVLTSVPDAGLVLMVLPPELDLPDVTTWIKGSSEMTPGSENSGEHAEEEEEAEEDESQQEPISAALQRPRQSHRFSPYGTIFPLRKTLHPKSYTTGKGILPIPSVSKDVLQSDCQKLLRFARNLPQKREILYSECEKLRNTASIFYFPSLMNAVITILEDELSARRDKYDEASLIIKDLMLQIRQNQSDEPLQPRAHYKATSRPTTRSAMSLDHLLN
ncbi:von Willebrand factor type A domain [Balamuthia mandrillaris]